MHTVHNVAKELISVWGAGEIKIIKRDNDPPEADLLHLNCDKAHYNLNWYPKWDFKKTIEQTANWYKSVRQGERAESVTRKQIIEYMEC